MATNRDDFTEKTKLQIAKRGAGCAHFRRAGPAAPGGPRYDEEMSPEERSSAKNGIWMCRDHGKAIDSTDPEFTVERLREWKKQAQIESWRRVLRNEATRGPAVGDIKNCRASFRCSAVKR